MSSAFLSYAHRDAEIFARELMSSLEIYVDVFWDRIIQPGEFPAELQQEIESRTYFLLIMSPDYEREFSWCQRELKIAVQMQKPIIPIRSRSGFVLPALVDLYTEARFDLDFDQGFRRLTQLIIGQPKSSWEFLSAVDNAAIFQALEQGEIPSVITKKLAEWVIIHRLWASLRESIQERHDSRIVFREPATSNGALRLIQPLIQQLAQALDAAHVNRVQKFQVIVQSYCEQVDILAENDVIELGQTTRNLVRRIKDLLIEWRAGQLQAYHVLKLQQYFDSEVAEKLRELIQSHADAIRNNY